MSAAAALRASVLALRAQLVELEELDAGDADADVAALRTELLDSVADASAALLHAEAAEAAARPQLPELPHSAAADNQGIHPRNRYARAAPDFVALAARQPVLAPYLRPGGSLDFADWAAGRALACALLKEDFGLTWWLPEGHLVPALTGRLNYLHWVEDLLGPGTGRRLVDVGTGASAIYALLGAAMNGWAFVATEVEPTALAWARRNVAANPQLAHLIEVRDASSAEPPTDPAAPPPLHAVLRGVLRPGERYAATLCNPPFFASVGEAGANPGTDCGGTAAEVAVAGGEAAFVGAHIEESAAPGLRGAAQWFTTLCGRKATLQAAQAALRARGCAAVRTTAFRQGHTRRWGLAWSWEHAPQPRSAPPPLLARPLPCARASCTLRLRRGDAASAVLAAVAAAAAAGGALAVVPAAETLTLAGRLEAGVTGTKRPRECEEAEDGEKRSGWAFRGALLQSASGELTVTLALAPGSSAAVQAAFGALAAAVRAALRSQWPSG